MATINTELPTLLDLQKMRDPDGGIATVVELLQTKTPILQDAVFQEGNLTTGHQYTSRTGLPSVQWRKLNEGVRPSKSKRGQQTETTGMLAGMSVVDVAEAKLSRNEAAFRLSEDKGFIQSMSKEIETGFIYHSSLTSPEKIMGLAPRFDSTTGAAGSQVIKADPTASGNDQTSVWLIGWGPQTVFGIFPQGTQAGLETRDMGVELWDDGTGAKFPAYVTYYEWKLGLVVKDFRYIVRVCNIDSSSFDATDGYVLEAMSDAINQLEDLNGVRPVFYVNRRVNGFIRKEARKALQNSTLTMADFGGRQLPSLDGIPIVRTDGITNTEATVA